MENKSIKVVTTGITCDNSNCDWEDKTVPFDEHLKEWINKPCPKCGENLLTLGDYNNAQIAMLSVDYINSLSEEQLKDLTKETDIEVIKSLDIIKDAKGLGHINDNGPVNICVHTHNGIKITEIKPIVNP